MRERGVEGASISDVMNDAGLTHGGFYKHFATKEAMTESALDAAFAEVSTSQSSALEALDGLMRGKEGRRWREKEGGGWTK